MRTKVLHMAFSIGIFTAGVITGKQLQKGSHNKKTVYAGTLQMHTDGSTQGLYLVLDESLENIAKSKSVVFRVSPNAN